MALAATSGARRSVDRNLVEIAFGLTLDYTLALVRDHATADY
jgi:hypothetical protein